MKLVTQKVQHTSTSPNLSSARSVTANYAWEWWKYLQDETTSFVDDAADLQAFRLQKSWPAYSSTE